MLLEGARAGAVLQKTSKQDVNEQSFIRVGIPQGYCNEDPSFQERFTRLKIGFDTAENEPCEVRYNRVRPAVHLQYPNIVTGSRAHVRLFIDRLEW